MAVTFEVRNPYIYLKKRLKILQAYFFCLSNIAVVLNTGKIMKSEKLLNSGKFSCHIFGINLGVERLGSIQFSKRQHSEKLAARSICSQDCRQIFAVWHISHWQGKLMKIFIQTQIWFKLQWFEDCRWKNIMLCLCQCL